MSTLTMPRPNKRLETTERHTAESIEHVASDLDRMVNTLRTAAAMLAGTPRLTGVDVRYERSLNDGLKFLNLWTVEVQTRVSAARLDAMKQAKK